MYAFGRFRDDGMKVAVSVDRIKNFAPKNLRDFNSTKWYGLRWEDEENSGYFRAQIMKLFATKEEADACTEGVEKRISCPKMPLYSDSEEDSCTSHDSYREEKKNKRTSKLRQKNVEATFRKKQLEALFPEEQDHKTEELEQEVSRLRAENAKLSARIEMLERALCSKIFDSASSIICQVPPLTCKFFPCRSAILNIESSLFSSTIPARGKQIFANAK
ncbi:uncharacterized protein [Dermacentor andersoni]|uniref:uncharacterized protein isoform X4 n=1 Tax=Dermacentor andersoni TaxID=34620 RepID=UPI003B3B4872